jgi:hypothetical protein
MFVYSVSGGFGKSDLIFSSYKNAQQQVLRGLRASNYPCPSIYGVIIARVIDSNSQEHTYKYHASLRDMGNLRFLSVEFELYSGSNPQVNEVLVNYTVMDDHDLVTRQLEDYSPSSPKYIYFNELTSVDDNNRLNNEMIGDIELVDDELISKYFKYRAYCYSRK